MEHRRAFAALLPMWMLLASVASAAGMREIAVPADSRGPGISGQLWTPCSTPPAPIEVVSGRATLTIRGAMGCAPSGRNLPLIVISHGMFGDMFSHHDTAASLADGGFAVLTLSHPLDSIAATRESVDNLSSFLARPVDVQRAIAFVLRDPEASLPIDPTRIGFFGFSRGGYTGLVLAGAVPDFRAPPFPCSAEFFMCRQIRDGDIPDHGPGSEPRITAFVIADPVSFFPDQASLQKTAAPIQLWSSEHGGMGVRPEDVAAVRSNLPSPPEFHRPSNAGHLSFQFPCSVEVAKVMTLECTDPPGFDRAAFHGRFNARVLEFFRKHLRVPSPH
jgi:predicted dienelactone hydrolase